MGFVSVGLDLSLTSTGIAAFDEWGLLQTRSIKSSGKKGATLLERQNRLINLTTKITMAVYEFSPQIVVVEAPSYGSKHGSQHDRSGLWWMVTSLLMGNAGAHPYPVAMVAPTQLKKYATGDGRASKEAVQAFVLERFTPSLAPGQFRIATNDEADATALAAMGAERLGYRVGATGVPPGAESVSEAILWPPTTPPEPTDPLLRLDVES